MPNLRKSSLSTSDKAIIAHDSTTNYFVGNLVIGSDEEIYKCLVNNGPITDPTPGAVDPVSDTNAIWENYRQPLIADYDANVNYVVGRYCIGSDNKVYYCLVANGPSSTVVDPVSDTTGAWKVAFISAEDAGKAINLLDNAFLEIQERYTGSQITTNGYLTDQVYTAGISGGGSSNILTTGLPSGVNQIVRITGEASSTPIVRFPRPLPETGKAASELTVGQVLTFQIDVELTTGTELDFSLESRDSVAGANVTALANPVTVSSLGSGFNRYEVQFTVNALPAGTNEMYYVAVSGDTGSQFRFVRQDLKTVSYPTAILNKGKGEELRECQRFYRLEYDGSSGLYGASAVVRGSNEIASFIQFPTMWKPPTAIFTGDAILFESVGGSAVFPNANIISTTTVNSFTINTNAAIAGLASNQAVTIEFTTGDKIELDASL